MTRDQEQPKTALTPHEKLRVAYFHLCRGIDQHVLADIMGVNPGRVNEAIQEVRAYIFKEGMPAANSPVLAELQRKLDREL